MDSKAFIAALALMVLSASPIAAACTNPPLTSDEIGKFKSSPMALVAPDSDARTIEGMTRDLAGADASLAADLVKVAEAAIPRYRTAIAAGLAQAAIACSNVDQRAALQIQEAVASFDDGQFQASFAAVAGDLSTAATAAAASSAASSAGSVVVINPATTGAATTPFGGGGVGSAGAATNLVLTAPVFTITDTAKSAADAVSPTR